MTRTLDSRWVIKRYKTFIFIGLVILVIQLHLAYFAINSNSDQEKPNVDNQQKDKSAVFDSVIDENSARQVKDNYNVDDEDTDPVDKVNVEIKNFLEFAPPCEINGKEAISSIRRAKTQKCKQTLVNVTCLLQNGRLYPDTLPNYCPKKNLLAGKLLGCYKDEKSYRLLSGYYANYKSTNSPEHCIRMCLQSGFVYAGVQYSSECFCGNDEPPSTARLPDPSCNMKCPANPKEACGGYFTINIYQTGIAQFVAQTAETSTESEAIPVRIAFLLTMNGRASRQIYRLIKALFHVDHYFYIHVDARQDYLYRELMTLEKKFPNIILARERYATIWGGASLLQMLLSSMRKLLSLDWQWDFIINLSESDFPVKTTEKLVEFLTANRNRNFVKSHGREVQRFIQKQGLDKTFVECDAHMWRTGDRKIPWGIQIDGGSDWVALSRDFVEYVSTEKPDPLIEGLLTFFKYTLLPAESFFHTALRNSKYCNTYIDNNLHVTNWKRRLGCKCQYKHVVDWCGCSPNDFKPDDWPRIQATESRQLYFARKFEPVINQAVILQLEQWLFGPHPLDVVNIDSYWQSVYHYADLSPAPDDALITITNSLARMLLQNNSCKIKSVSVVEVFSYHRNDIYKGSIINFNAVVDESKLRVEVWVKPVNNLQVGKATKPLLKRLKTFYVSSDYDQKEQLSRNFGRFLGPYSDPVLIYEFLPSLLNSAKSQNVSFLWIDSAGRLADVSEASIDIVYVINTVKLNVKQPLLPGVWTVKLVHEKTFLAQCTFLITPLEFLSKKPISQTESVFVNGGSTITHAFANRWDAFLKNKTERDALQTISKLNTKRYGVDLREWVDSLVSKSYKFVQSCIINSDNVNNIVKSCESELSSESCLNTVWSSKAPDPKSYIGLVNSTTGRLNRF